MIKCCNLRDNILGVEQVAPFVPRLVFVDRAALAYPLAREITGRLQARGVEVVLFERRLPPLAGGSFRERFLLAKRTMVVSLWRGKEFQTCRPSADYQLPLVSGCPGRCEYCYLNTNRGRRPYIKVYVNVDDIFARARDYVRARQPLATVFEGSATSDPVAVEAWTGLLRRAIEFFAAMPLGSFRFATKYADVDPLLALDHKGKTEVRFSINCDHIINRFERGVPSLRFRLEAARTVAAAGYPLGFLIAPIFVFEGWREQYLELLRAVRNYLEGAVKLDTLTFELITHRFTVRGKRIIEQAYPDTEVPLTTEGRRFKYGQFGYGKYVYPEAVMRELEDLFRAKIKEYFPGARILYFV